MIRVALLLVLFIAGCAGDPTDAFMRTLYGPQWQNMEPCIDPVSDWDQSLGCASVL